MFSVLFRKSFNGNGLVFEYQTKNSLLRQLYSSACSSVFLVFPIIRAISFIVTWLFIFMASTILSSSVCFTGTFTGTSSFSNPLLSNGIVMLIVDVPKSYALASVFPDDLQYPESRLLDDVTLEEDLHELLVHRMSFAGKEIFFCHPAWYRAIGNDFKPVIVPIDCGRNAFDKVNIFFTILDEITFTNFGENYPIHYGEYYLIPNNRFLLEMIQVMAVELQMLFLLVNGIL